MAYASNMMRIDAERLRRFAAKNGGLAHISRQMGFGESYVDLAGYAACGAEISARDPKRTAKRTASTTGAAGGTETGKTASCVKLQRMDGYYLVDVDGNSHRFTLWETAMQFIRERAGELT